MDAPLHPRHNELFTLNLKGLHELVVLRRKEHLLRERRLPLSRSYDCEFRA
eukprot:CAMPEP_0115862058 /NCGR_PEP_ID=MMETSP0287-20121206/17979_1 /TAXON_ID=412157 /ORGANISM="Chrysochromulina rotalis, Strain UIO044" /LENGTH=50 /DNA_ID=CAMNT_0003316465 /DNA_START=288 /DNA_END=437 /DNA_ORIENTATION=-